MTHTSTEQDRAEFEAWWQEWGLGDYDTQFEAWQAARRAPVAPMTLEQAQQSMRSATSHKPGKIIAASGLEAPQPPEADKWTQSAWSLYRRSSLTGAKIRVAHFPAAAPVVERKAAPVQLPEPVAEIVNGELLWHIPTPSYSVPLKYKKGRHDLIDAEQVRQLLAAHGIGKDKA